MLSIRNKLPRLRVVIAILMMFTAFANAEPAAAGPATSLNPPITFLATGACQTYTVPSTGTYVIEAAGAQGGADNFGHSGGLGADMTGTFQLTAGQVLQIVVGKRAAGPAGTSDGGGGGGGSFVFIGNDCVTSLPTAPLLAAGGGGGGAGGPGLTTTAGGTGAALGGTNGAGGNAWQNSFYYSGGGGTGWIGLGQTGSTPILAGGGTHWNGGAGGNYSGNPYSSGGFGGGGAAGFIDKGSGGGGGYSGGGGGAQVINNAGGGGSFNAGSSQTNSSGVNTGDGVVQIYEPLATDNTAPVITYALTPSTPDGANDWYKSNVTLVWSVTDPESPVTTTGCLDQNITADQDTTTYSCSATSAGGSSGPVDVSIKRDAQVPAVALVGGPANSGSYYFGSVPAAPTCSASDALSGLDGSCAVTNYSSLVGPHTVSAAAQDMAGNQNNTSAAYTVLAWMTNGFFQPVDMGGVVNTVKNGSTVPLKFEVFAGSTELTDTSIVNQPLKATQSLCSGGPTDEIELLATGATSLRYDATAGQFIYNWQTPKKPGYCYVVTVTLADGTSISANFKLK